MSIFPTHILLATDGSPHADLAAGVAVDLARSTGSRLHVVAVGRTFPAAVYDEYAESRREDLRREAQESTRRAGQEDRRVGAAKSQSPT